MILLVNLLGLQKLESLFMLVSLREFGCLLLFAHGHELLHRSAPEFYISNKMLSSAHLVEHRAERFYNVLVMNPHIHNVKRCILI